MLEADRTAEFLYGAGPKNSLVVIRAGFRLDAATVGQNGSEQGKPDRQPNVQLASEAEEPRAQTCKRGKGGTTGAKGQARSSARFPLARLEDGPGVASRASLIDNRRFKPDAATIE